MSSINSIKVIVKLAEGSDFDINKLRDKNQDLNSDQPPPKMVYESDNELNTLVLKFDQIILLPSDIKTYSSENVGNEVFQIDYLPSDSSIAYGYENELQVDMTWKVNQAEPERIEILLDFSDKSAVSVNPHDPDKVEVQLLKKEKFVGAVSQKVVEF